MDNFKRLRNGVADDYLANLEFSGARSLLSHFKGQWGLKALNVHQAHAALASKYGETVRPGEGVIVGIMDSGVDLLHPEFVGASITEILLQGTADEVETDFPRGHSSHGNSAISVMAAQPNGTGFIGIAWGATFKMFARDSNKVDWVKAYRSVLESGVDIVIANHANGGSFIENYTADSLRSTHLGPHFELQAQKNVENPTIFVFPANNDHGRACRRGAQNCFADSTSSTGFSHRATSPSLDIGAVALLEELQGHVVVSVAVNRRLEIASFSNRCGIAGPWCIAAPGIDVTVAYFGPYENKDYGLSGGTSLSAPLVSGGLALIKHFFRDQLSNREVVTRLFATANKKGIYAPDRADGTSSIYGQGLMDLGAALSPAGTALVITNGRASENGHSIRTTRLRLGGAFGDGLSRALAGREIAAFDALGAPFWFDLSGLVGTAHRPSAMGRLHGLIAPVGNADRPAARGTRMTLAPHALALHRGAWRVGLNESPATAESSLLNLAGDAATVTFKVRNGFETTAFATMNRVTSSSSAGPPRRQTPEMGALLAWRPADAPVGVRVGWLREGNSLLGSTATGGFGGVSANDLFTGFEAAAEFGGWRLAFDAEIGLVAPSAGGGLIDGVSWLTTSATSLRADRRLTAHDEMTVSVSQPPRVETGTATFRLPVGRTQGGAILRESFSADLAPSARQIDLAARWRRTGVFGGEFRAEAAASHNPGHAAGKPLFSLLAGWRAEF